MRGFRAAGLLSVAVGCASPTTEVVWAQPQYAAVVALYQSCTGDPSLALAVLEQPRLTHFVENTRQPIAQPQGGCAGLEAERGVVVTQDTGCSPACSGNDAVSCRGAYKIVQHCGRFDGLCALVAGEATCIDKPGSTSTNDAAVCPATPSTPTCRDNDRLEICAAYGRECPIWLADSGCSGGHCLLGSACTPGKFLDGLACDGNALRVCVAGRIENVDCIALGFTGCDPFTRGCSPNPLLAP